jgi:hypothetical protein
VNFAERLSLVFVSALSAPAICLATQKHSWCRPGDALRKDDPGTDANTNDIIKAVCAADKFATSCDDSGTRWSLSCVKRAADKQYFPRVRC